MNFSTAQQTIIRELCSIEFDSLERILIQPVLGKIEEDDEFSQQEILDMHECTREDYDEALFDTYERFQRLHDEPTKLFETLGRFEMIIFIRVLGILEDTLWKDRYPNALINLWNKVYLWEAINLLPGHEENQN